MYKNFQSNTLSVSSILMILSLFFTLLTFLPIGIYQFGMNSMFYDAGNYFMWAIQMFTSQFLHGGFMHLVMNAIFILYFGNALEQIIGSQKYMLFFILNAIFLGVLITFLSSGNTVGISGFAMAVISYYTLHLWSLNNPQYTGGVTAIIVNVLIGLTPGISFLGHFGGALFGAIFWYFTDRARK